MQIENSVVIITGAAMRVGRTIALELAKKGAIIVFSYYLDDEPWQATMAEIKALGSECLAIQTEIRSAANVKNLVEQTIERFGRVDVLINNASVWLKSPVLEITEDEWDLSIDVNLKGPFLTSQAVASHMLAQGQGLIVNITDLSAFQTWPGYAHHAASKAGLVALTKSLAVELAPNIRVNAIAPGTVLLPENATSEKIQWAEEKSLLKQVGEPEDVANLVAFLIENEFTTGAVYFVDGGRSLV
ncbi:MAG: SDR family oxidoreductase [Chloroflexi bacterium]|nr:SDR family oxidoreductase [Chloroflexota bacterium]MBL6966414.1 SDR family oxidoreductase [Anaerolineales bacterium]